MLLCATVAALAFVSPRAFVGPSLVSLPRPLLVAHAKLPRSIFGAISPAARFAKRVHDRTVLQRLLREGARIAPRE